MASGSIVIPFIAPVFAVTIGAIAPPAPERCEAPFGIGRRDRAAAPSLMGAPGLFEVPAAVSAPDRSITLAFNSLRNFTVPGATQQRNGYVSVGFLPRITLFARMSVMDNDMNEGYRGHTASFQVLSINESRWLPSIALGAHDVAGLANGFAGHYGVASKTFLSRARVSFGFGEADIGSLNGAFGGIEIAPCSWLTLIGENDSRNRNAGVRIAPLGGWGVRHGIEPTVDLLWREGQGRMAGVGLRLQAPSPRRSADEQVRGAPLAPATLLPAAASGPEALRDALVRHGFENVRVSVVGDTLAVAYENRVFHRDEWDALGVVMGEAAGRGGQARFLRATILRVDVPVMQITTGIELFREFVAGTLNAESFAAQVNVNEAIAPMAGPGVNPSRFKFDFIVRPRMEKTFLNEISVLETRWSLQPGITVHLGRGLYATGRHAILVHETSRYPHTWDELNTDQWLLHAVRPGLPLLPRVPGAISQVSVGRFGLDELGASLESDVTLSSGRVSMGGVVALFGDTISNPNRSMAIGSLRVRNSSLDLTGTLSAGRFKKGDVGWETSIERRYGLSEVAFFGHITTLAKSAGIRVSVPFAFARDMRPRAARLRMPGYHDLIEQARILDLNFDERMDGARRLDTWNDLRRAFRGRDRINESRLKREVETLREAALRWVSGDGSAGR
jgi:hypothetical protein